MRKSLFPKLKDIELIEYSDHSAYEKYTGIVLDPEDKIFKTVSGMFHDKKDFYEKLSTRGYIVRKVFESRVFSWIDDHAKSNLDAYLLFSTAFSKWKGNNLLNSYYTQLLNDIPQLNREKRKGDPNSVGINQTQEESIETTITEEHSPVFINTDWPTHNIKIIPLKDGSIDKEIAPLEISGVRLNPNAVKVNDLLRSNPNFIYQWYSELADGNYQLMTHPSFVTDEGPVRQFLVEIDGRILRRDDNQADVKKGGGVLSNTEEGTPVIVNRASIIGWNRLANQGQEVETNAQARANMDIKQNDQASQDYLTTHMADINAEDQAAELYHQADNTRSAIPSLTKNKLNLIKGAGGEQRTTNKSRNLLKRYEDDIHTLANGKSDPEYNNILKRWDAENRDIAVVKIKNAKKALLNSIEVMDTTNSKINDIENAIKDVKDLISANERAPYHSTDEFLQIQNGLQKKLASLLSYKKYAKANAYTANKVNTKEPEIKGWTPIQGYRAKFVKGNPNDLKDESCDCEKVKRITWNDGIPVVDELNPGKHVNHGAMLGYLYQPIDGVITNPGAITMSGTFMTEQDEHWGWVHDKLNQELFAGTHLKPEVRDALLRIANKFKSDLGIGIEPVDIYFTGSGANFNYNDLSDIDLHLVYDFERIGINAEILIKYFIAKKQVFNNDYEIRVKGMPVEVGVENLNEPAISSAVYSLMNDQWLVQPEYAEQLLPQPDMKQYYELVQKIEDAIETRDSRNIGELWTELYDIRKTSLKQEGEYSKGNALFKKLRNLGYLDRLKHAYYSSASEELSLEALEEII